MLAYLPFAWPVLAHFSLSCQLSLKTAEEISEVSVLLYYCEEIT